MANRDICLQRPSPVQIAHTTDAMCRDALNQLDGDDVDAIVQVGTNLSMVRFAAAAEFYLGKPVIAINTATYWHALRAVGLPRARLTRDYLRAGLQGVALNPALADRLGGDPFTSGVVVTGLQRNSIPARIGLRPNDLVVQIDGRAVTTVAALGRAQRGSELTIVRNGRRLTGRLP